MEKDFQKVLVTGGAGFIGSYLVDSLIDKGFEIRVVDNLSSGNMKNLEPWLNDSLLEFVRGDLKDPDVACRSVDGVEVVFHLVANPEVRVAEIDRSRVEGRCEDDADFNEKTAESWLAANI